MRRKANVDSNQAQIVRELRIRGFQVLHTHQLKGFVDIMICKKGFWCPVEIKNDKKVPNYFWKQSEEDQDLYLESMLTTATRDNEYDFMMKCKANNSPYIVDCTTERIIKKFNKYLEHYG